MDQSGERLGRRQVAAARARLDEAHLAGHLSDAGHAAALQSINGVETQAELDSLLAYFDRPASAGPPRQESLAYPAPHAVPHTAPDADLGTDTGRRSRWPALVVVGALLTGALVAGSPANVLDRLRDGVEAIAEQTGTADVEPLTAAGFEAWRDRLVEETGSTMVVDATVHSTYAVATVETGTDPVMTRAYLFDGDWEALGEAEPRSGSAPLIDLADFDPDSLAGLLAQARTRLEIPDPDETMVIFGTQVTVTSGTGQPSRTSSQSLVQVTLSSESRSGSVSTRLDGTAL